MQNRISSRTRKHFLLAPALLLTLGTAVPFLNTDSAQAGEIRYVRTQLQVPLREQARPKSKIITNLNLSDPLEVLQEVRDWAQVKTADGTVGWMALKYLDTAPVVPAEYFQPDSPQGNAMLEAGKVFKELNSSNEKLKQELAACSANLGTVKDKYDTMTRDPESIVHTKTALEKAQARMHEQEEELAQLQINYKALKMNQSIMWFLAGAGALFLGWLIGRFSGGGRKQRGLY